VRLSLPAAKTFHFLFFVQYPLPRVSVRERPPGKALSWVTTRRRNIVWTFGWAGKEKLRKPLIQDSRVIRFVRRGGVASMRGKRPCADHYPKWEAGLRPTALFGFVRCNFTDVLRLALSLRHRKEA
jgi:hypothetical protein